MPLFLLKFLGLKKYILSAIPFIIQHWKIILIASMAGLIIYQNTFETRWLFGSETIPSLEKRLGSFEKALDTCEKGNIVLTDSIEQRNKEVLEWKRISDGLQDDIIILQKKLIQDRDKTNTQVNEILNSKTPQTCTKSIQFLKDGVGDLKW